MKDWLPTRFRDPLPSVDDLFREFFNMSSLWSEPDPDKISPNFDVREKDDGYIIEGELPGVKMEDIDISVNDGVLTICGEKKRESKDEGTGYRKIERSYGTFRRAWTLTNNVDQEKIDASFKDGVLTLILPKISKEDVRKVEIKAE